MAPQINTQPRSFSAIDYRCHPAFLDAARRLKRDIDSPEDEAAAAALDEIDAILVALRSSSSFDEASSQFRAKTQRPVEELKRACRSAMKARPSGLELVESAVEQMCGRLLEQTLYEVERHSYCASVTSTPPSQKVTQALKNDGLSLHHLPHNLLASVFTEIEPHRNAMKQKALSSGGNRTSAAMPLHENWWLPLADELKSIGAVRGASDYMQHNLSPLYCALVYSHEGEVWWRNCYADANLPTSSTAYMHHDEDHDIVKIMVYLSEVELANGPFSSLRGSHHWPRSISRFTLWKMLDSAYGRAYPAGDEGGVYYRQRFKRPELREEFLLMPRSLQGTSHFGDDVVDGTPESELLRGAELPLTSDIANCMVFTGSTGVHRGACVQKGERWAFQIALREAPSPPPLARRVASAVKRRLVAGAHKVLGTTRQ